MFPVLLIMYKTTTDLINGKCHNYIRLLVDDLRLSSRVAQICLNLNNKQQQKQKISVN